MKTLEEIKKSLSLLKKEIHERYGVSNVEVFGSYVRGEQREGSDLDVLVEFDRRVDLLDVSALQILLSERLGMKVDVVLKRSVRPELKGIILGEAVPV
ncbi:MAG: nucleotidyltransferase family protein [Chitinispirillaceae bacterium]|nr:nucleotidyltransferase family protein [Chitinispirillaceae bacterium]